MCRNFTELSNVYSHEQIQQGLWAVLSSSSVDCQRYLFDPTVDINLRIDCIESMNLPFRDVVARHTADICETFYWMWWDMILHTFWLTAEHDDSPLNDPALNGDPER